MTRLRALRQSISTRLLSAFEVPAYRQFWLSTLINSSGAWVMRLAAGWLMLELTNSAFWVGLITAAEGVGQMGFGVFAGVLVDRFDSRKVLVAIYGTTSLLMFALGVLVVFGWVAPWHLLAAGVLRGVLYSAHATANNAVIYQIVGRERLMNATAMKGLCFNLARIGGSALAGAIIAAAGVGPAYLASGAITALAVWPLLTLTGVFKSDVAPTGAMWRAAAQGIGYVWRNTPIRTLWLLSAVVEMFAFSYMTMIPVFARDVLGVDAQGLGSLSAAGGVGALVGIFVTLNLSRTRRQADWLLAGASASGLALVLFAVSRSLFLSMLLIAAVSLALVIYDVLMSTLITLLADDAVRGRVLALYTLTFGFNAGGGLVAGAIASSLGAPLAVAAIGGVVLAYVAGAFRTVRHIRPAEHEAPA